MVLGVIIGECAAMLGLMDSKELVDEYHAYSCTELLGFLPSSTLQAHAVMQLVLSKSFHTANSEQNRLNFCVAPAYFYAHSITGYKLSIIYGSRFPVGWI